jgi:hypothetical protein
MSHATAPIASRAPASTKVSNPLMLERIERRGGFGSLVRGDDELL